MLYQPVLDFTDYAPRPVIDRLPALRSLWPAWQGQYDGFSYLYAIINALRLLLTPATPLSEADCRELFCLGIRLADQRHERAACGQDELAADAWLDVARVMARQAALQAGFSVAVEQPFAHREIVPFAELLNLAVCDTDTAQTAVKHRIAAASILTFAIRRAADPVMTAA